MLSQNSNKRVIRAMIRILIPLTIISWGAMAVDFSIGIFVSIFGSGIWGAMIILFLSGRNSAVFLNLNNNVGILARWILSETEAQEHINQELKRFLALTKTMITIFIISPVILAVIGFLPMPLLGAFLLGLTIAAFTLMFSYGYRKEITLSLETDKECVITMAGTKVGDIINDWSMRGRRLAAVSFNVTTNNLVFTYYTTTRTGKNERVINIPVPLQYREKAAELDTQMNRWLSGVDPMP